MGRMKGSGGVGKGEGEGVDDGVTAMGEGRGRGRGREVFVVVVVVVGGGGGGGGGSAGRRRRSGGDDDDGGGAAWRAVERRSKSKRAVACWVDRLIGSDGGRQGVSGSPVKEQRIGEMKRKERKGGIEANGWCSVE